MIQNVRVDKPLIIMRECLNHQMTKSKVPPKLPEWVVKASWDATSMKFKVYAKNEVDAWNRAWKRVSRMEGGDSCLKVVVLNQVS